MVKKKNKKKMSKSVAVKDQQLGKKKETAREKMIGQSIGYRYDVNLLPDYNKMTPFLKKYRSDDLNWLEDVHMGYEEGRPQYFVETRMAGCNSSSIKLPNNQQDRDMIARELLVSFKCLQNILLLFEKNT